MVQARLTVPSHYRARQRPAVCQGELTFARSVLGARMTHWEGGREGGRDAGVELHRCRCSCRLVAVMVARSTVMADHGQRQTAALLSREPPSHPACADWTSRESFATSVKIIQGQHAFGIGVGCGGIGLWSNRPHRAVDARLNYVIALTLCLHASLYVRPFSLAALRATRCYPWLSSIRRPRASARGTQLNRAVSMAAATAADVHARVDRVLKQMLQAKMAVDLASAGMQQVRQRDHSSSSRYHIGCDDCACVHLSLLPRCVLLACA